VTAISLIQPRLLPDHVDYEDDNESFIVPREVSPQPAAAAFATARRRVTDDKVVEAGDIADEGDFILRRESDFGLRRNVARTTSQRSGESADGNSSSHDSWDQTPVVTSRRTGLPTRGRVSVRQREQDDDGGAQQVQDDLNSGRVTVDDESSQLIEPAANDFAAAQRQAAVAGRQRLRQELRKTTPAVTEEPSSRAAAAEGRAAAPLPSSRARTQFQRPRTVPPEAPLAVALPRSGHSASVDNAASQQVASFFNARFMVVPSVIQSKRKQNYSI
jgi:hypothetical protein